MMEMSMAPSSSAADSHMQHSMMMHMTLFWGKDVQILVSGWPGGSLGMYVLSLIFVFSMSMLVEWLALCRLAGPVSHCTAAGLLQTLLYTVRVGLGYLVMLAAMSFNVGILIVAVAGHCAGFLLFGSSVFKSSHKETSEKYLNANRGVFCC